MLYGAIVVMGKWRRSYLWRTLSSMTTLDRRSQSVVDSVTMALLDGVDEATIHQLVRAGIDAAARIEAARAPIDWEHLPTIGSCVTI